MNDNREVDDPNWRTNITELMNIFGIRLSHFCRPLSVLE